ncbi:hypothetical protein SASPL_151935 [Salvia splendens]|uniref:Uncharacterized protein n=1 Tax=Salvia splendens TaxID=180675 RepID=A0A8X8W2W0_SALSN|nr:hypothetical protein SASPL_151935 [Salvia splendens]
MPASDSRCSAAAAHRQVVVSAPLPLPRPLHRPPPPRPGTLRYGNLPPPQFHLLLSNRGCGNTGRRRLEVLIGMGSAGCVPDCDSYGGLIAELSEARNVDAVAEVVREMM